mmetsp:Transcript_30744/g.96748  ORF Transcript_30744/g.96748 Transcript_30744/m.96748 type:complete len:203 (+) Transcript_30744:747-1355(+)
MVPGPGCRRCGAAPATAARAGPGSTAQQRSTKCLSEDTVPSQILWNADLRPESSRLALRTSCKQSSSNRAEVRASVHKPDRVVAIASCLHCVSNQAHPKRWDFLASPAGAPCSSSRRKRAKALWRAFAKGAAGSKGVSAPSVVPDSFSSSMSSCVPSPGAANPAPPLAASGSPRERLNISAGRRRPPIPDDQVSGSVSEGAG